MRLVVGPDAPRNGWLTLLLVLLPLSARAFDGSVSVELAGGNQTLSASLIGDWGIVPDKLYLVGSYGVLRQRPASDFSATPSHLLGLGLDWMPSMHWMTSVSGMFSPKATETTRLTDRISVSSTRRSAQGILAVGYQSGGLDFLEWSVDVGGTLGWHELESTLSLPMRELSRTTPLVIGRPSAGAMLSFDGKVDVALRGSYSIYSRDPTTICRESDPAWLQPFCDPGSIFNLTTGFLAAPPWFDARAHVLWRLTPKVSGRVGYTLIRYVNGIGTGHAVHTKWTWRVAGWARLWAGITVQYDWLTREPGFWSGYGTLGAELATE